MSNAGGAIVVLTLLLMVYVAFQYSTLRMKYKSIFGWYERLPSQTTNIGPMRIALSYERPWLAQYITRPIPQTMAEFMIRLVNQQRINPLYLTVGPAALFADPVNALNTYCQTADSWGSTSQAVKMGNGMIQTVPAVVNPLSQIGGGQIPFWSELVQGYRMQIMARSMPAPPNAIPAGTKADLSLLTLWMHGYEEYIRQRSTAAATSVLQEWNFMFAADVPAPVPQPAGCSATAVAGDVFSAGVGAAGVGAMMGAPEASIPGAIIGFILGAGGSLFGNSSCL